MTSPSPNGKRARLSLGCVDVATAALGAPLRRAGAEVFFRCPNHEDSRPSLQINTRKNCYLCAPCSSQGTAWRLAAFLAHLDPGDTKAVAGWLREHRILGVRAPGPRTSPDPPAPRASPARARAPARTKAGFTRGEEFYYSDDLRKVRFDPAPENAEARKYFVWEHRVGETWLAGQGGREAPLYTNETWRDPDAGDQVDRVVGFEGEAKTDLAAEFHFAGFSFKNLRADQCDVFGDLDVVLWPDKDLSGDKQMKAAAKLLDESKQPRRIRVITPPAELPEKGDILDAVKTLGWGKPEIDRLIASAKLFSPEAEPEPEPEPQPPPAEPTETRTPTRTPRRKSALKCFFDFRSLPLEAFRLPEDGRQAQHLCRMRRAVARELSGFANADGSHITVSVARIGESLDMPPATVHRRLADLHALQMLETKRRGFKRTSVRTLKPAKMIDH